MQHPATLLEAKGIAEELELTQSMVKAHQKQKKTIKAAQHSGTQERRSGRLYQSVQRDTNEDLQRIRDRDRQIRSRWRLHIRSSRSTRG